MKKKILSVFLALAAMTTFTACGSNSKATNGGSGEKTIVVWHQLETPVEDALKKSVSDLETSEHIKVKFVKQNELSQKLTVAGQNSKDLPDLIIGPNDWTGKFSVMGIIDPISKAVDKGILKDHLDNTVEAVTYKGESYGVPMTFECLTFMYNKKLLATPPKTTDDLLKIAKENTKDGNWGFVTNTSDGYHMMPWIYGFNGYAISKDGAPGLSQAGTVDALNFIKDLTAYLPKNVDYQVVDGLFKEGKAASIVNGSWAIKGYKGIDKIDLGIEVLPVVSKSGKNAQPLLGVQAAMVMAKSSNKKEAGKVLESFASEKTANALLDCGYLVSNKKVDMTKDPITKKLLEQANFATPMPNSPEMSSVWEPLANALKSISTDKNADVKKLLDKAQKDAEDKVKAAK